MRILNFMRSLLAFFILKYILGWNIKKQHTNYDAFRKGRYVTIYLHTSIYDHIIGILFSYAFNLKFITVGAYRSNKDTQITGITYLAYNLFDMIVVDPFKDQKTTCCSIISDLEKRTDFIFSIYPEGSIHRTTGLKSGFYKIARSTNSDILLFSLDYNKHEVDLRKIIDRNIVTTASSDRILEISTDEMMQTIPYDITRTFILNKIKNNMKDKQNISAPEPPKIIEREIDFKTALCLDSDSKSFDIFAHDNQIFISDKNNNKNNIVTIHNIGCKESSLVNINNSIIRFMPSFVIITFFSYCLINLF